jgi:plastocyanin
MKRTATWLMLVLMVLCSAAAAADDAKGKDKEAEKTPATKRTAKTHTITIKNSKYTPASLTIHVGDTIIWKNDDDKDHTVIADDKSFKSENISSGDNYTFAFKKAGTFKYGCKYHPREKGTITVEK